MTNCEKFNAALNSCRDPQAVYMALLALAGTDTLGKLREGAGA